MSQVVINVSRDPDKPRHMLFTPALAHQLERGDLITLPIIVGTDATHPGRHVSARRILALRGRRDGRIYFSRSHPHPDVESAGFSLGINEVVLRAVGARAARGGAR